MPTVIHANDLHFTAEVAGEGPLVVCLHGFPDSNRSFRHQLPALAESGFRVVVPTARGYEPSAQPNERTASYHILHVAEDLVAIASELGAGEPVHLVGHDWGSAAGYLACQLAPECFASFCGIAVPCNQAMADGLRRYPSQAKKSWYMVFFQFRQLAERHVRRNDFAFIERLWRDWSPGWTWDVREMQRLKQTLAAPRVVESALSYYRASLNPALAASRRSMKLLRAPVEVPTLAVTGELDGCIDTRIFDCTDAGLFPRGLRIERVANAGHFVHQECPNEINELLIEWIRSH